MKLLTNAETAALLGLKSNTLEIWRVQGKGPVYIPVGRSIRYDEDDVIAWLKSRKRSSTSQKPPNLATA